MIVKHFVSIWYVLDNNHRRNIILKSVVFLLVCFLPFLFKITIANYIAELVTKYGIDKVKVCCLFIALVLLCGFVYDFNKKQEAVYPNEHFSVYQMCGLSANQYKTIQIISCIPEALVCIVFSYVVCCTFLLNVIKKVSFLFCYCFVIYLLSTFSVKNKHKYTIHIKLTRCIRSFFLKNRCGAVVAYFMFYKATVVYMFLQVCLTILSYLITRSFFSSLVVSSWFSIYIVPFLIDKHNRDSCFHQLYPQTFNRLIKDNMVFSSICYLFDILLLSGLIIMGHGSYDNWTIAILLVAPNTMLNHLFLYRLLAIHLPYKNPVDDYAPLILILVFILLIPGISLILIIVQRHRTNYRKPIFWGEKKNASS